MLAYDYAGPDAERFEEEVWESVNEDLADAQVGSLDSASDDYTGQVVTIGITASDEWYGVSENDHGQHCIYWFADRESRDAWFDGVTIDL